jgi:hypothetical protein
LNLSGASSVYLTVCWMFLWPSHACSAREFPGIAGMTRAQQKRGVAACIERFSEDPKLLAHPDTEPLIIDC